VGYQPSLEITVPYNNIVIGANVTFGALHSREFWYGAYDMPLEDGYNDAWDEHDRRVFASAYVQDTISLFDNRLTITPGVKYLYAYTTDTDAIGFYYPYGGTTGNTTSFVSPTIGVNYKLTEQIAVYGAFGQSVKFPDISAYYDSIPGTTGSPPPKIPPATVKPEHVNDYELGVRYQEGGLSTSLALYREDFTNTFIDTFDPTDYLTIVTNGGSSRYQGVEFQVRNDFGEQPWGDFTAKFNVAYNQAEFTSSFTSDYVGGEYDNSEADFKVYAGEALQDVPNWLISAVGVWSYQGWKVLGDVRYVGRQFVDNYETGVTASGVTIQPFTVVDLGASKTIQIKGWEGRPNTLTFALNVDNLFNEYYYNQMYQDTYEYYVNAAGVKGKYYDTYNEAAPGAPRSIVGTIDLKF